YCTDVAKMIEAPVFHVNGDDPEAVCFVTSLALQFRCLFQRDAVIDMYCYRKHGHNEADEPAFTQPTLYKKVAAHPAISSIYTQRLIAAGTHTQADSDAIKDEYSAAMEQSLEKAKQAELMRKSVGEKGDPFRDSTAVFQSGYTHTPVNTSVSNELIQTVIKGVTALPPAFLANPKIKRVLDTRAAALTGGQIDWGMGETLAFGTLLVEGTPVRLSGQDCERGTFSHRHAVLYDTETREKYVPLLNLQEGQARFCVYNSLLSEAAVLGFDYGYTLDYPQMLCIWEAQFGDFANGAQVVIDQFISSGESKWQRLSGIVLLLPHGYEGQGPEHSSARLERFLQLCAEDNLQVVNLTTPANYFHALRRQMKSDLRKPLIVMAPKSLLRHPLAVSKLEEFTAGAFQPIMADSHLPEAKRAKRVILCSGKVYYDLHHYRVTNDIDDTAIIRIEQLYPLHKDRLAELAKIHKKAKIIWCQEEPQNMGAWSYLAPELEAIFDQRPTYIGREAAASPAVGALAVHKIELNAFLTQAFQA
ncbi:MAG: 2-oxoglutarate dehydrogenase E1 component, partial [Verrucomicrobia bacterium]